MTVKIMLLSLALVAVSVLVAIHAIELHRLKREIREFEREVDDVPLQRL